jgi:hypothetical protein
MAGSLKNRRSCSPKIDAEGDKKAHSGAKRNNIQIEYRLSMTKKKNTIG